MGASGRFGLRKVLALTIALMMGPQVCWAKDLTNRLGVGFRDSYSAFSLPSLAAEYYPNSQYGVIGALGIDTEDQNSKFALSGGVRKIIFAEENLNFFMSAIISAISDEEMGSSSSGFELAGLVGTEFFLAGLENLGFSFEAGVDVSNVNKVRFSTIGASFVKAGIMFYF